MNNLSYHFIDVLAFPLPSKFLTWLDQLSKQTGKSFNLTYSFCSDDYLLQINRQFLNHDYYTDIITFDQTNSNTVLEADLYISSERVEEHSKELGVSFANEISRVMAHGVFHLLGFGDKTEDEALKMRELEDEALLFLS